MDKGITRFMKGRLRIAAVIMVCMVVLAALPAVASASVAWSGNYPAPASTLHTQPGVVGVDALSTVAIKSATIQVGATVYEAAVVSPSSGTWTRTEVLNGNVWMAQWTFVAGGSSTKNTLYVDTATLATGTISVAATVTDTLNGTYSTAWTFDLAANGTNPPTQGAADLSPKCVLCHGTQYNTDVAMGPDCEGCHKNGYAPKHGFDATGAPEAAWYNGDPVDAPASGHNAKVSKFPAGTNATYTVGAKSKFDGTQGVTLTWTASQAFTVTSVKTASSTNGTASVAVDPGTSFTVGQTGTVQSNWDLPTKGVFWNTSDADAPGTAMTGLSWTSVISCQDCHTGVATAGPHGAANNWGLDPNYPGDYERAKLTKQVTAGGAITAGAAATLNSKAGIAMMTKAAKLDAGQARDLSTRVQGTSGSDAVICAKCHKLEVVVPAGVGPGTSGFPYETIEGANTAHDSHHQDQADGSDICVNCHIGVPHGWKRPRLLVDTAEDAAPYNKAPGLSEAGTPAFWGGVGMESLSALNNHPLIDANGYLPFSTSNGTAIPASPVSGNYNVAHSGTVIWDEGQCEACEDHFNATYVAPSAGSGGNTTAIPVRIDQ